MAETVRIQLVAPEVWQPALDTALRAVAVDEQPFVQAALGALQRRHIGITPNLLCALAPALLRPHHRGAVTGAWGAVYDRLLDSLRSNAHQQSEQVAIAASLTLSADASYVLMEVVIPLVQKACGLLGYACLLCADSDGATVKAAAYQRYDDELTAMITDIARNRSEDFALFWRERAYTLSSLARGEDDPTMASLLPLVDPLSAGMFLRLQPLFKPEKEAARRRRRLSHLQQQRNLRWREEGFDGIHHSHNEEDLPHRLTTEYLYDPMTQLDRILNTGFLALEREPRRVRMRDVLIVAYLPHHFWRTVQGDFLRACWFDFAMRAALLLRQNTLLKSEFRWVEADALGRSRTLVFRLEDMPDGAGGLESSRKGFFRTQFCTSLRWLPRIADVASGAFQTIKAGGVRRSTGRGDDWFVTLWRLQEEQLPVDRASLSDRGAPLAAEEFVYTFHMPFLPTGDKPPPAMEARQQRAMLAGRLHAERPYQGAVCLTWAPLHPGHVNGWYVAAHGSRQEHTPVDEDADAKPAPDQLAGEIVDAWLDHFLKEAPGG